MASDRLIHFVCTAADHHSTSKPGLTQYEGEWAMCPELLSNGHDWFDTGGVPVKQAVDQWRGFTDAFEELQPAPAA